MAWRASYEAYGEAHVAESTLGTNQFNIRFPGQYWDQETGLHYNRFRYYDPEIGRYVSADPIGQFGLVGLNAVDPQSIASPQPILGSEPTGDSNPYRYAVGDPVNGLDPYGLLDPGSAAAAGTIALGSGVSAGVVIGAAAGAAVVVGGVACVTSAKCRREAHCLGRYLKEAAACTGRQLCDPTAPESELEECLAKAARNYRICRKWGPTGGLVKN